jgi:hypothetical protein
MDKYPRFDYSKNQTPEKRRSNKRMTDKGRNKLGMPELFAPEEKDQFVSTSALKIVSQIDYSDVTKPIIKRKIEDIILASLVSNEVSEAEAEALLYHLEESIAYQENIAPPKKDFRESQFKDQ